MANLQEQVKDICRLADAVIQNPITPITTTANSIGVCSTVAVFAAGGQLILSPLLMGPVGLVIAAGNWIFKKLKEKERMLRITRRFSISNRFSACLKKQ